MSQEDVIERIKSGSREELENVYRKYRDDFISWMIGTYNCSLEDAKDLYQQIIIVFYENIINEKLITLTSSIKTYLFAIGRNRMYQQNRASGKLVNDVEMNLKSQDAHDDEKELVQDLHLKITEASLKTLGDPCRILLELYYYHKKTMKEIVETLNYKNSDTVKNLKYKCLKRLKLIFDEELRKHKSMTYG